MTLMVPADSMVAKLKNEEEIVAIDMTADTKLDKLNQLIQNTIS